MKTPSRPCASNPDLGACGPNSSVEELNRECFCPGVDQAALHARLEAVLREHGLRRAAAVRRADVSRTDHEFPHPGRRIRAGADEYWELVMVMIPLIRSSASGVATTIFFQPDTTLFW